MENNDFDTFDVNYDAASDGYKFDCFSEITDYTLQGNGVVAKKVKGNQVFQVIRKNEDVSASESELDSDDDELTEEEQLRRDKRIDKKKKRELWKQKKVEEENKEKKKQRKQKLKKRREKRKKKKAQAKRETTQKESEDLNEKPVKQQFTPDPSINANLNMSAWQRLMVPPEIISALREKGFETPTPIQQRTILPSISKRADIVGAAETGSGKTLAFCIPILTHIMKLKAELRQKEEEMKDQPEQNTDFTAEELTQDDEDVKHYKLMAQRLNQKLGDDEESDDEVVCNLLKPEDFVGPPLYALIVTPTRELAMQINQHLRDVAKYTGIKNCVLVGGIFEQKQLRLLKKNPEIVVATPGRLWDLMQQGHHHLAKASELKFLVIDEADRMLEGKENYQDFKHFLASIDWDANSKKCQTFIYSATLSLVHKAPKRFKFSKHETVNKDQKLDRLMKRVGIRDGARVIDLSSQTGTAASLLETRIMCAVEEKEAYLYYLLHQYPGRTLVFCNSIKNVKRLDTLLNLLKMKPKLLHGSMQMKQRLKNLDNFRDEKNAVLIATDVAARGLDICNVEHVIHFQVPPTTEYYVHRSGRTARAQKDGVSVMLISAHDIKNYKKIVNTLNRDEDIPLFPTNLLDMKNVHRRVNLAQKLYSADDKVKNRNRDNDWFRNAAKELDVDVEELDVLKSEGSFRTQKRQLETITSMKEELKELLNEPLIKPTFSKSTLNALNIADDVEDLNAVEMIKERKRKRAPINTGPKKKKIRPWFNRNKKGKKST